MSFEKEHAVQKETWDTFQARLKTFSIYDRDKIDFAYQLSKVAHGKQKRISGERYFEHPRRSTIILLDECKITNPSIICATLLHDSLEDTSIFGNPTKMAARLFNIHSFQRISKIFYPETAEIVFSVTEPYVDSIEIKDKVQAKKVKYERLENASEEALLVKMADRLDNLRTFFPKEGQKTPEEKIKETREILIPIFRRAFKKYPIETTHMLNEINKAIKVLESSYKI